MENITPNKVFEEHINAFIQRDLEKAKSMDVIYQFHVTGDQASDWVVDLSQRHEGPCVKNGTVDQADCTITVDSDDFVGIVDGSVNPISAFMFGKIKVEGDVGQATKLQSILG